MRITILWSSLASYSVAFFKELAEIQNCQLQLIYQRTEKETPYEQFDLEFCNEALQDSPSLKMTLERLVLDFAPNCILMSSWPFKHFMKIAKMLKKKRVFVISCMDNQWHGTVKQWLGVLSSRWFLKQSIDNFLVAGDRQADFARKLGYDNVFYGLYAAEVNRFSSKISIAKRPKCFLFVGRLIPNKGLKNLIEAYKIYRERSSEPWGLKIVGEGELRYLLRAVSSAEYLGFVQPAKMPLIMENASCFVLPSLWEPWGVVIHEAASAGLPIIATYTCGATTNFVRDGVNGYVIPPRAKPLVESMLKISSCTSEELERMSQSSFIMAKLWTPRKLADYFVTSLSKVMARND